MKKILLGTLISTVLFAGIIWMSYPDANQEANQNNVTGNFAIAAEHNSYDFGKISMKEGKVSHTFRIANTSGADVNITRLFTSCMCTTAEIKSIGGKNIGPYGMPGHGGSIPRVKEVFSKDAEVEVEVVFDPAAHGPAGVGRIERSVIIENDGGDTVEVKILANVTP